MKPIEGTKVKVTMTGPNRGNVWAGNHLMIDVEIADGVPLEFILPHKGVYHYPLDGAKAQHADNWVTLARERHDLNAAMIGSKAIAEQIDSDVLEMVLKDVKT